MPEQEELVHGEQNPHTTNAPDTVSLTKGLIAATCISLLPASHRGNSINSQQPMQVLPPFVCASQEKLCWPKSPIPKVPNALFPRAPCHPPTDTAHPRQKLPEGGRGRASLREPQLWWLRACSWRGPAAPAGAASCSVPQHCSEPAAPGSARCLRPRGGAGTG